MTSIKLYLAGLSTGAVLLAIAAGFFLAGDLQELRHLRAEQSRPRELGQTAATAKAPERSVPCPAGGILAPDLTPRAEAKLRAKYGRETRPQGAGAVGGDLRADRSSGVGAQPPAEATAGAGGGAASGPEFHLFPGAPEPRSSESTILGEYRVPRAPHGGTELAELFGDGHLRLTFRARPTPYIEWRNAVEIGGLYGVGDDGQRWRAWAGWEPLRLGRIYLRGEAGGEGRAGGVGWYAMAGAVWRPAASP
jgi:hypothetical protein